MKGRYCSCAVCHGRCRWIAAVGGLCPQCGRGSHRKEGT